MEPRQNIIIGIIVIVLLIIIVILSILWFDRLFVGIPLGSACQLDTDCQGWGAAPTDVACCDLVCTKKQADYIGVGYCPGDCKGCPTCRLGTCGDWSTPKKIGEPCGLDTDCEGYGPGVDDNSCCNGLCAKKIRDWGGSGVCPNICQSAPGALPDTCSTSWHWPREINEPCALDTDCLGWGDGPTDTACCGNICERKQQDYLALGHLIGYCPSTCRACGTDTNPACFPGTCSSNWSYKRKQGEPCTFDYDCDGWTVFGDIACCQFHCIKKDSTIQSCLAFCDDNPHICDAPYPD